MESEAFGIKHTGVSGLDWRFILFYGMTIDTAFDTACEFMTVIFDMVVTLTIFKLRQIGLFPWEFYFYVCIENKL